MNDFLNNLNKTFSTTITINRHKELFMSVKDYLHWRNEIDSEEEDLKQEVLDKMIELNTVIEIKIYPSNSVGFYVYYGYDLVMMLEDLQETFKNGII